MSNFLGRLICVNARSKILRGACYLQMCKLIRYYCAAAFDVYMFEASLYLHCNYVKKSFEVILMTIFYPKCSIFLKIEEKIGYLALFLYLENNQYFCLSR